MWKALFKFLTGDIIGRAFDVIDKKVESERDREKMKSDVVQTWLRNRVAMPWFVDFCFIGPLALWWASVCVYSILWHSGGPFPQGWDIAALPAPMDEWAGWIIGSRFGLAVVQHFVGRK